MLPSRFSAAGGVYSVRSRGGVGACLITKTDTNPFFVKMRKAPQAKADELGVELRTFAGKFDGDNEGQVAAIENLIAAGAKGILITASDTKAIVPTIKKARDAGILVIALDTPLDPIDAADATFATDNFKAGVLIGAMGQGHARRQGQGRQDRASSTCSSNAADRRRAARPGLHEGLRHRREGPQQDTATRTIRASSATSDRRHRGRRPHGDGEPAPEGPDINVVYTINEPAAAGAYEALKAVGKDEGNVLIVSVDGGCPGVKNVEAGVIGATSQQYPAADGVDGRRGDRRVRQDRQEAEADRRPRTSSTPASTLITDKPVDGVTSIDTKEGLAKCWG